MSTKRTKQGESQSESAEQTTKEKLSTLQEIKKSLLGQFLAIILTPLTVYVTLLATEKSKIADAKIIDGIGVATHTWTNAPPAAFYDSLKSRTTLYNSFLQQLYMENPSPRSAEGWLSTGEGWDDDCSVIFKQVSARLLTLLTNMEKSSKKPNGLFGETPTDIEESKIVCNRFLAIIKRLDSEPDLPTGQVDLEVSVLNNSSYEGLIYSTAKLEFDGKTLYLDSDSGYVQLKPHSIKKITFPTYYVADDGKFKQGKGSTTFIGEFSKKEQEAGYRRLSELVQQKKEIPFVLTITVDGKDLPSKKDTIAKTAY